MKERDGRYYAEGRLVCKRPIRSARPGGKVATTMGFRVCEICEFVPDEAASLIAAALNHVEFGDDVPQELLK